jgi:hypothetical protein
LHALWSEKTMTRFVFVAKLIHTPVGQAWELRDCGELAVETLQVFADVAKDEGFHLMFECVHAPDMERAGKLAQDPTQGMATLPGVVQLWVLNDPR